MIAIPESITREDASQCNPREELEEAMRCFERAYSRTDLEAITQHEERDEDEHDASRFEG